MLIGWVLMESRIKSEAQVTESVQGFVGHCTESVIY